MTLNRVKLEGAVTFTEYLAKAVYLVFLSKTLIKARLGYQIYGILQSWW